jgi:signal transduction histidine kinase
MLLRRWTCGTQDRSVLSVHTRLGMQQGIGGRMAGLGFGLPLARLYAAYFGGSLELVSLPGHGVDVFLRLVDMADTPQDLELV